MDGDDVGAGESVIARAEATIWTRVQAEAGQPIEAIVARKEAERLAGGGTFAWGVGNAPSRSLAEAVARAAGRGEALPVVFSLMAGRPRAVDASPERVALWRRWRAVDGSEGEMPDHVGVTSRWHEGKACHRALFLRLDEPLRLGDLGPFDPTAWRNAGPEGRPPGASQVTALLERHRPDGEAARYRVAFRARLEAPGWVTLLDPVPADREGRPSSWNVG